MLVTSVYEVRYLYEDKISISKNDMSDHLFSQVDEEGNIFVLLMRYWIIMLTIQRLNNMMPSLFQKYR